MQFKEKFRQGDIARKRVRKDAQQLNGELIKLHRKLEVIRETSEIGESKRPHVNENRVGIIARFRNDMEYMVISYKRGSVELGGGKV